MKEHPDFYIKTEIPSENKQKNVLSDIDLTKKRNRSFDSLKISLFLVALYGVLLAFSIEKAILYHENMQNTAPLIISLVVFALLLLPHFYFFGMLHKLENTDSILKNLKQLNKLSLFVTSIRIFLFGIIIPLQIILILWMIQNSLLPGSQTELSIIFGIIGILSVIAGFIFYFISKKKIKELLSELKEFNDLSC